MYANIELLSKINDRIQIPFLPKCSLKSKKIASEIQLMYTSVGDSDYYISHALIVFFSAYSLFGSNKLYAEKNL